MRGRSGLSGLVVGAFIVAIGVLLLLDNLGIVRFHNLWDFWPLILVIFGVAKILECHTTSGYVWGGMLALFGGLLLLDNLGILTFEFSLLWPVLLVGFGISMLVRALDRRKYIDGPVASGNPDLAIWAIFSGVKRRIDSPDFKGGDIVAIFGGVNIDLRHAGMTSERVAIDVNALFGGVDIRVPENWNVVMKGVGIFGAFEDKTIRAKPEPDVKNPQLVITGSAIFGGTKVDN
jgi:predicted membrane protein